ncbi:MAG: hypothetical protein AB9M53_05465 [Leptothrix sp. (in: b-proteobacteria)]
MLNPPNPALVSQRAVQPLPRLALLILCAAYVLPGVFGRDPWKNADITAVGFMTSLARGEADWLHPTLIGIGSDGSALPYWIGAVFMRLADGLIDPYLAVRLPFALMLALTLALVWHATRELARTDAAQPLAFAFGGEARPLDYARALADGSVLAMVSVLGLLQLGHETTPELVQLLGAALFLDALACGPTHPRWSRIAFVLALPGLAISGAATTAIGLALAGGWICWRSQSTEQRRQLPWLIGSTLLAAALAALVDAWLWRIAPAWNPVSVIRLLSWFIWPVWPLAAWTLWQWRRQMFRRHVAIPLATGAVALLSSIAMGGSDRALMLALPGLAVLAAFALPTLQRGMSAAIDWFAVFFFSCSALAIWVIYAAMHTRIPPKIAANISRLAPGFEPHFQWQALALAALASLAWIGLVRWRTNRQQHALWKGLVLSAGGVALNWLLLMTLWLPVLDYARSYRPLVQLIHQQIPADACVATEALSSSQLAALLVHGPWPIERIADQGSCGWLLVGHRGRLPSQHVPPPRSGWAWVETIQRPTELTEFVFVFRRI